MKDSENRKGIIHQFHSAARENGICYLIIGGYAASFWGRTRFTADIDYVLKKDDFDKAKSVLGELGIFEKYANKWSVSKLKEFLEVKKR